MGSVVRSNRTYAPASVSQRSQNSSPQRTRPGVGQRSSGSAPRGSLTISDPPDASSGAPNSATVLGGPNDRAVTTSAQPRRSPRPTSAASTARTSIRSSHRSRATARFRRSARPDRRSMRSHRDSGLNSANTRAGSPTPLPRSAMRPPNAKSGAGDAAKPSE